MAQPTVLCMSSYFKGGRFIEACRQAGCHTILLTKEELRDEAWPHAAIDERFLMPTLFKETEVIHAVSYLARTRPLDLIIALDDFDVEMAASLREHMRIPGLGDSQARFFRDKLAMRVQAQRQGIPVPAFVQALNYDRLRDFMARVPAPWVLKPRGEASAMGIKKLHHADELWPLLDQLGDRQSFFLLERFVPGDVYHVDSVVDHGEVRFAATSKYGAPPMTVYQGGGVFITSKLPYGGAEDQALQVINRQLMAAMGLTHGVTHAEFIRSHADGQYYFLEIAARVGGVGIDLLMEHATGINPWVEWARVEIAHARGEPYTLPPTRQQYTGLIVSLARQAWPDLSAYNDPEVVWHLDKKHHVGMLLASPDYQRIQQLLGDYAQRIAVDFTASAPPIDRPPERDV
ncbi:MAG: ATP-grasp domain-containing protein [Caldilineaceae bacterium]|nr:ATP-grasp domain-containing protein [Caldilineaceae bacterium]